MNAHKINRGEHVTLDNKSRDFFFLKRDDANVIISVVLTLIRKEAAEVCPRNTDRYPGAHTHAKRSSGSGALKSRSCKHYLNPPDPKKREREYGSARVP